MKVVRVESIPSITTAGQCTEVITTVYIDGKPLQDRRIRFIAEHGLMILPVARTDMLGEARSIFMPIDEHPGFINI